MWTRCSSGFLPVDATVFGKSKSISKPNFVDISQWFMADIKTNIRHIGILLPVPILVILPQSACYFSPGCLFYPNRRTYCGNITSHWYFKMAAAAAQYYFRFPSCWYHCIRKAKSISKPNFANISQFTAEIWLLPVFAIFAIFRYIGILLPVSMSTISP